ncbi:MAG TPA: 1,4-dihydroxy-2-naphthoate polyprenyltransferase [Polyangiaceae bacterium]|nr:1,4-dihydroxy-2-naphthoate polyprenyltransferase [Polyangiaceae bacterium]
MTGAGNTPPKLRPHSVLAWWIACRPKTLSAAAVPVAVGSAVAYRLGGFVWQPALAALLGAVLLQIGSNFANDVFDFEKGADTHARLGPLRAVQAGLITPRAMRLGMGIVFGLALLVGVYLTAVAGPVIVLIGLVSIGAAIAYTAGPYPLGYHGLGDVFVLLFFGFVAVCGSAFVQLQTVPSLAIWAAVPVGSLATAILVVNNVRDCETDVLANKRTLAVRFGRRAAQYEYLCLLVAAYLVPLILFAKGELGIWGALPGLTLPWAGVLVRRVFRDRGALLNRSLVGTAKLLLLFGVLFTLALTLDAGEP